MKRIHSKAIKAAWHEYNSKWAALDTYMASAFVELAPECKAFHVTQLDAARAELVRVHAEAGVELPPYITSNR